MAPVSAVEAFVARRVHRLRGASVASTARVPLRSRLSRNTSVGAGTWINGPAVCKGGGSVRIGEHCAIGEGLLVTTTNHATRYPNTMLRLHWRHGFVDLDSAEDVVVGPAGWLADRVTLLPGARLGTGVVVAAGAVVPRGDHPDYAVLAGVPARVVRLRAAPEVVAVLVESRWWTWPADRVARNRAFFETDIGDTDACTLRAAITA